MTEIKLVSIQKLSIFSSALRLTQSCAYGMGSQFLDGQYLKTILGFNEKPIIITDPPKFGLIT